MAGRRAGCAHPAPPPRVVRCVAWAGGGGVDAGVGGDAGSPPWHGDGVDTAERVLAYGGGWLDRAGDAAHRSGATGGAADRADHGGAAAVAGPLPRRRGRSGPAHRRTARPSSGPPPTRPSSWGSTGTSRCSPWTSPRSASGRRRDGRRGAGRRRAGPGGAARPGRRGRSGVRPGVAALAPAAAVLRHVRCAGRRRRWRARADLLRRGVRSSAVSPDRAGDHRAGRGARLAGALPVGPARGRARGLVLDAWPASSRSARAWRTRCAGRWPRRRA